VFSLIDYRKEFAVLPYSRPPLVSILPKSWKLGSKRGLRVKDLAGKPFICREQGSAVREAFEQMVRESGLSPSPVIEVGSREGIVSAVAEGVGAAFLFDEILVPSEHIQKLQIIGCGISSNVDVVCLAERQSSQIVSEFVAIAGELSGVSAGQRKAQIKA
ncbi:MAG: LysR substrate-binding domain-containing protein, partial [Methyloligellaceae bacterium]